VCAAKNTLAFAFGDFEFKYIADLGTITKIEPAIEDAGACCPRLDL
jgi:hypothetical protein